MLDGDGDGQSNAAEHIAGTNPLSAVSVFRATAAALSESDMLVTATTVTGKSYQLETSTSLVSGSWSPVGELIVAAGPITVFTHIGSATGPKRFYRVSVSGTP